MIKTKIKLAVAKKSSKNSKNEIKRLAPTIGTLKILFLKSGNECAFTDCNQELIDSETDILMCDVCHIKDALPGERYEESMSEEERRHISNLMLFCKNHHEKTKRKKDYLAETLMEMKAAHEAKMSLRPYEVKKYHIENLIVEIHAKLEQILYNSNRLIEENKKLKKKLDKGFSDIKNILSQQNSYGFQLDDIIDTIRELFESNQFETALSQLLSLRKKAFDSRPAVAKYKILTNIGFCHLELGNEREAAESFITALHFEPNNERALSIAGLGFLISGNKRKAERLARKAIDVNPFWENSYIVLANALEDSQSMKEILQEIPVQLQNNPVIAFNLGQIACRKGLLGEGIFWYEVASKPESPKKIEYQAFLATTILRELTHDFSPNVAQISKENKKKIESCIDLLTRAWELFNKTELRSRKISLLINRGIARRVLSDFDGAFKDMKLATEIANQDAYTFLQLAISCRQTNRLVQGIEAVQKFEELSGSEIHGEFSSSIYKAEILIHHKKYSEAIEVLIAHQTNSTLAPIFRSNSLKLVINCHLLLNNFPEALAISKNEINKDKENATWYILAAKAARRMGQTATGLDLMYDAKRRLKKDSIEETVQLAKEFMAYKQYLDAAILLDPVVDKSVHSELSETLLHCYMEAGELTKTLEICNQLKIDEQSHEIVAEIEISIYGKIGDFQKAFDVCRKFLEFNPDNLFFQARLAMITWYSGDMEAALSMFLKLDNLESLPHAMAFQISEFLIARGEKERGLLLAYLTRRSNFESGKVHNAYVCLYANRTREDDNKNNQEVAVDNCVIVKDSGDKTRRILLRDSEMTGLTDNEIDIAGALGSQLVGKEVGEIAKVQRGAYIQEYEIVGITSKYSYAFLESLDLLENKFYDVKNFFSFDAGGENGIESIMKLMQVEMERQEESDNALEEQYKRARIPLGMIAGFRGINIIEMWMRVVGANGWGIYSTSISRFEYERRITIPMLKASRGLVFDLSSLLTFEALGICDLVESLPSRKVIPFSAIQQLEEFINGYEGSKSEGFMSLGRSKNQFVRFEMTKEDVQAFVTRFKKLVSWIRKTMEILPCNLALTINAHDKAHHDGLLGRSTFESLLLAKEHQYCLVAEESVIREFAAEKFGIVGFSTFNYLYYEHNETKKLNKSELVEKSAMLCGLSYHVWMVEPDVLLKCLEFSKHKSTFPFDHCLALFAEGGIKLDITTAWLVEFLRLFFLESHTQETKLNITLQVLYFLKSISLNGIDWTFLRTCISMRFELLPVFEEELLGIIRDYMLASSL